MKITHDEADELAQDNMTDGGEPQRRMRDYVAQQRARDQQWAVMPATGADGATAENIVGGWVPTMDDHGVTSKSWIDLRERVAAALSAARAEGRAERVHDGHVLYNGVVRKVLEKRWYCTYCCSTYIEYVNGCPRCHMGEAGTSTSVEAVLIVSTREAAEAAKGKVTT